jgi:hypothetical protein
MSEMTTNKMKHTMTQKEVKQEIRSELECEMEAQWEKGIHECGFGEERAWKVRDAMSRWMSKQKAGITKAVEREHESRKAGRALWKKLDAKMAEVFGPRRGSAPKLPRTPASAR